MYTHDTTAPEMFDVLVVGAGPVGLTTAIQLGTYGWRVGVVERWPEPYALPRAVVFDHEVARVLAAVGLGHVLPELSEPASDYEWRNANGETLLKLAFDESSHSGWPYMSMFTQPRLEEALERHALAMPTVHVLRGWEAVDLAEDEAGVLLTARRTAAPEGTHESRAMRAAYVVGCDGANSFVRSRMDVQLTDLGFQYDWLVLDVIPHDRERVWSPLNLQLCDPERPSTVVSGGPGRRRWEFMRMPGETVEELNRAETAWKLLEPWDLHPGNATLERHSVYTFQARWADSWRKGRLLLAGDAAHLMPPFAGQGMCSGIRDAANLSWKLHFVLSGQASESLLDTYTEERSQHLQHAIELSVFLGRIICEQDRTTAAERDTRMLADQRARKDPLAAMPARTLTGGMVAHDEDGRPTEQAGRLAHQGRVRLRGRTDLFDQVVGAGFALIAAQDPRTVLDDETVAWCAQVGLRLVTVVREDEAGPDDIADVDGTCLDRLEQTGQHALLVRPDHYVFGGAPGPQDVPGLVAQLRERLSGRGARPTG
ncbi:bifunctional 3-(3-hydroxy-phenyl)propionate/3-hydroxycinnamic acid hydroxylase [Streptomyces sp. NPDC015492]|uniref:bifunctional 3-(3-hydroxy-phenyl)propionate/3-hydroxycinnamic acid hydroxylase MhpA n=1 Tax=Streptomyces sp. NPDC015492 TaxID=3364958 RepID=UPI003700FE00